MTAAEFTADQLEVLTRMSRAGGGWYPLQSTWVVGDNQHTNTLCKALSVGGYVECVGGDPDGQFVCDWRLTAGGLALVQSR